MRKLLTPHVRAIGRPAGPAQDDAVDPAGVEGTPAALKNDLIQLLGQDQVLHRVSDLVPATRDEKAQLDELPTQAYLSANRTCEMGLRQATGYPYESFVFLLEELTR